MEERGSGGVREEEGIEAQYIFQRRYMKSLGRGPGVNGQCGHCKDVIAVGVKRVEG